MKFQNANLILVLMSAVILIGCGDGKRKQQIAAKELEQTKKKCADAIAELETAQQKVTSLTASLAEQEKPIQGLNDAVKAAKASNAEKEARIDRLMNLEESAFDDAESAAKAGDKAKALTAYKAFARDFPLSAKVALAQGKAKEISDAIYREKWVAEAPMRAARARNARLQSAYNEGFSAGKQIAQIWRPGNNRAAQQLGIEDDINNEMLNEARDEFQTGAMYQKYPNDSDAFRAYMQGYDAGVESVGGGSFNYK